MDKSDKINQIKEYISKIEEDLILSEKNDCYTKETLMTKNILECLKLFSEIIEDKNSNSNKDFFISKEQLKQIEINGQKKISDIANELNKVTQVNNVKKLQAVWITDWLLDIGMLQKNAENNRIATQSGRMKGITSELKRSADGREYYLNYYSEKAQKFINDNMDNILKFHYDKKKGFQAII